MGSLGAWNENWVCLSAYSTLAAIFFLLEIWFSTLAFLFQHEVTFLNEFHRPEGFYALFRKLRRKKNLKKFLLNSALRRQGQTFVLLFLVFITQSMKKTLDFPLKLKIFAQKLSPSEARCLP